MGLSNNLISQFVKITKDDKKQSGAGDIVYGTTKEYDGSLYVQIDGSELLTPVTTTTDMKAGERVTVVIKNHTAIATGNLTSPSARTDDVEKVGSQVAEIRDQISEFEIVIADKVSAKELDAEKGRIDTLISENVTIKENLNASEAKIDDLVADNVTINEKLIARDAEIEDLKTKKLDAEIANVKFATVGNLDATNADIHALEATYGDFEALTTNRFVAVDAAIGDLETKKLDAESANLKFANVDFSNIGKAAIEHFYATSGLIKDVVVGDGTVTGELVGVTIKGDLIEGNTIVADKLVIKGKDGLYYKLNTDGVVAEAEQTEYNSINGSIITAHTITATKINVDDLVAFDATIGGFNISDSAIYSGTKSSVSNTTRGIYLGRDGQIAFGDSSNFIKYYKDADGKYKLAISAQSISISATNKTVEETLSDMQTEMDAIKDEVTTCLRIESSRGTVFKNDQVSTVLSAVIYRGSSRIIDIDTLKHECGPSAYLQWSWQRMDDSSFGTILSTDSRIGNDGFTFTLSPDDVDTKVTFMCQLMND